MTVKQKMAAFLMLLGVVFFLVYLWWPGAHPNLDGIWGTGIWLVAVGTFLTGTIVFFTKDIYRD